MIGQEVRCNLTVKWKCWGTWNDWVWLSMCGCVYLPYRLRKETTWRQPWRKIIICSGIGSLQCTSTVRSSTELWRSSIKWKTEWISHSLNSGTRCYVMMNKGRWAVVYSNVRSWNSVLCEVDAQLDRRLVLTGV